MNLLVLNSGSSSIKYQFFRWPTETPACSGLVERIGLDNAVVTHKVLAGEQETTTVLSVELPDHEAGLREVARLLADPQLGVLQDPGEVEAVGHRVVHGGEEFAATVLIIPAVKEAIRQLFPLAPLHNPANYRGIEVAGKTFPQAKQIAVFDTAFHQTMPEQAYRYAIPTELYAEQGIRVYGFHGTSHKYVTEQAAQYLGNSDARLVSVHLGNGCSITAVRGGQSLDTSMGFGPLAGLVMGTRSGDIDPSVVFHLISQLSYTPEQVSALLNKQSGMLALTGLSDMRDITAAIEAGDANAKLAYDLYAYRIKKYIGAYAAALNGLDAIIFTAGVGENDALVRKLVCQNMDYLGVQLDEEKNTQRVKGIREISQENSPVKVLIVPTNEELEIARQCVELLETAE
ncbi:acetate/propionate family kinase [Hymenobacter volaticus]|uniref:Acetate kinase n=1 Tax=Hymenobacter volaticus TaxID=2932254 RepID=A0ABY4G6P8_9BACT|nr:acetate kinase [Hymenobacter volaticus]UOQ66174.1 acetate kinase [Hymenobacter volaticus]